MTFSIWISNGGCEACDNLEGIHLQLPARPHDHCLCTILDVDLSSLPGRCVFDEHLVIDVGTGDHDIEYVREGDTIRYTRIVLEYTFTVLCRDATIVQGTGRFEDPDPDLPFSSFDDTLTWLDVVFAQIEREAQLLADEYCPRCAGED